MDNLEFIRETMERASAFTAVPGWGMVVCGAIAMLAAVIGGRLAIDQRWLALWLVAATASVLVSGWTIYHKARAARVPLLTGSGRKFFLSFAPPLVVGAALTLVFARAGLIAQLPSVWLLLYGTAVITGGAFSVRIVPVMGLSFLIAGFVALALPTSWDNIVMAATFGAIHVGFGIAIARRHGG
jgi:hypothetical protein